MMAGNVALVTLEFCPGRSVQCVTDQYFNSTARYIKTGPQFTSDKSFCDILVDFKTDSSCLTLLRIESQCG